MRSTLRLAVFPIIALAQMFTVRAQCPGCTPDLSCVSDPAFPTLCPLSPPDATAGVAYQADITFWLPPIFTDPGTGFTVDFEQMTVTGVEGMPFGLEFETNAPGSVYYPQQNAYGCARLCGTPLVAGTYAVDINILAGVNFNGFDLDVPQTFSIVLNVLPGIGGNASFTYGPTSGCGGVTASFEALIDGSPAPTFYQWAFGNGGISDLAVPPAQTYTEPGTYVIGLQTSIGGLVLNSVTLTGVNGNWCGDVEEPDVPFVGCTGDPDPYFVLTDATGGTFTSATLDNTFTGSWNDLGLLLDEPPYSISFYDEDAVSQNDLLGTYNIPANGDGTYFINVAGGTTGSLSISTEVQQTFFDTDTITVYALPTITLAANEVTGELCTTPDTLVTYTWFHDGDTVPGATDPCLLPDGPGLWRVSGTTAQGCSALSDTAVVCPTVTIERDGLTLFVPNVFTSYAWSSNGMPIGGDQPFLIAPEDGTYTLTVTDANGCEVTVTYVLSTVGMAEVTGGRPLPIFPNPNNGNFILTLPADLGPAQAHLLDASGRVVQQYFLAGSTEQQELSTTAEAGTYLLLVEAPDRQGWQARVVVE
ncbi:MAG TPA: T9SS type A sorting domain-containing protein [Flavobacteriales bacterium]|jgi:PKD repeat protein|nr:T9SS type A sorting domain-containing protein [Flavobacteriales bacterium]